MLLPDDQRRLLGAFLRSHREALLPDPATIGRRRTPGLRREEVARMCGLSTTWYTWAEQGRDIALSAAALARLADGLRLTVAERAYLFELTRRRDPSPPTAGAPGTTAPDALLAVLRATTAPAYLLDRLWHVRGWNDPAGRLFAPWFDSGETCLLRYVFLDPTARAFIWDWEDRARRVCSRNSEQTRRTIPTTLKCAVCSTDYNKTAPHLPVSGTITPSSLGKAENACSIIPWMEQSATGS